MNTSQQRLARARAADILHELETVYRVPRALIDELRGLERRFLMQGGTAGADMGPAATDAAFRQILANRDAAVDPPRPITVAEAEKKEIAAVGTGGLTVVEETAEFTREQWDAIPPLVQACRDAAAGK